MSKLTELTQEQWADVASFRQQRWEQLLAPVEKPKAERALRLCHELSGLKAPETIVWVPSPLAAQGVIARLKAGDDVNAAMRAIGLGTGAASAPSDMEQHASIMDLVRKELSTSGAQVQWPWHDEWFGCWVTFYAWCKKIVTFKPDDLAKLDALEELTAAAGWIWSYEGLSICAERPVTQWTEAESPVLHAPSGPAVRFPDGWSIYVWRGTVVPREWIEEKERVDPTLALTHENVEMRRILAEIIGWTKVLEKLSPRIIHTDPDPEIGQLLEVNLPDAGPTRFLRVKCPAGQGREFVLPVPGEMQTARQANAWTYGLTEKEYFPEFRS